MASGAAPLQITRRRITSAAVADPAVRARIEELGAVPAKGETATPEYLARMLKSDIERWAVVIKAAGVSEPAN